MTLTVTTQEAKKIIIDAYKGTGDNFSVNILSEDAVNSPSMNFVEAVLRVTKIDFPGNSILNNKILAVKKLREYVKDIGLLDAKCAVENPERSIMKYLSAGTFNQS